MIAAASLITGINSDLLGLVVAQVTENVHDMVTGDVVLIPQGSRLIGAMTVSSPSGSSALLIWQRILMLDDSSIEIDSLPATDTAGYAGPVARQRCSIFNQLAPGRMPAFCLSL